MEPQCLLLFFTFMGPCIVNVFKHNQQNATLHNGIYYYKRSTCFRRFLRPSSGAQNCLHSIGYLSSFFCFVPLSWLGWNCSSKPTTIFSCLRFDRKITYYENYANTHRTCVQNYELLHWDRTIKLKTIFYFEMQKKAHL
jgi:hypothetical protein